MNGYPKHTEATLEQSLPTVTDGELFARFLATKDASCFEEVMRRYAEPMRRFLMQNLCDHEAANDALQELWLILVRRGGTYDPARAFKPWLYTVAFSVMMDMQRKLTRERRNGRLPLLHVNEDDDKVEASVADERGDPVNLAIVSETEERLAEALRLLGPKHRAVVDSIAAGNTYNQTAAALGIPVGTVKGRLNHAREMLREALGVMHV